MGIMGVLNHAHGGWEDVVTYDGNAHDAPIAHRLLDSFESGRPRLRRPGILHLRTNRSINGKWDA